MRGELSLFLFGYTSSFNILNILGPSKQDSTSKRGVSLKIKSRTRVCSGFWLQSLALYLGN